MTNLETTCKNIGLTYSLHHASTGSRYYLVNGVKFRISDHDQPSHYQVKNYFDVSTENEIEGIIKNDFFTFYANPISIGGEFFDMIHDSDTDTFSKKKITENEFHFLLKKMSLREDFYTENNYKK